MTLPPRTIEGDGIRQLPVGASLHSAALSKGTSGLRFRAEPDSREGPPGPSPPGRPPRLFPVVHWRTDGPARRPCFNPLGNLLGLGTDIITRALFAFWAGSLQLLEVNKPTAVELHDL